LDRVSHNLPQQAERVRDGSGENPGHPEFAAPKGLARCARLGRLHITWS
jgi:hypothetical protein